MKEVKLSLGCGREKKEGFVGLDKQDFGWNKIWDATTDQIPMGDSTVNFIEMENMLEHIERKYWIFMFNECHRVLKPGGKLEIVTPDAAKSMELAMQDPTHVSFVIRGTFTQYMTGARPRNADYGIKPWFVLRLEDHPKDERIMLIVMRPNK